MNTNYKYTFNQVNLISILRKLWEQHVMWTRSFIISTAANLKDLDQVTKRLLRNPTDFANQLSKYYGNKKASDFEELLREHLLIAADLVNAAKAGRNNIVEEKRRKWYENADKIAAFLSSINPYWNEQQWKTMLHKHLEMTEREAVERLKGQFASDIMEYGNIEDQALMMADYMSQGIIRQFNIQ
jgi:phage terminase Nu1 subunit (DNA packaging protein)